MKIWIFLILAIFLNIYSISVYAIVTDKIVAIVNNRIILNSDIKKFLFFLQQQKENSTDFFKENILREKVIRKLILENILLDKAEDLNITVTDAQVDQVIENIALQKKISLIELKNNILFTNKNSFFKYDDYRNNIKKALIIQILQENELYKNINITEKDINHFFSYFLEEQNKHKKINVSYIFIPFLDKNIKNNVYNTQFLSESIIKKINNGYRYEDLYRKCIKNNNFFLARNLSWISFFDLQKKFSNSLNIIKKGDILGPFLEKNGFYILKIHDIETPKKNIITECHLQQFFMPFSPIIKNEIIKKNIFHIYKKLKKGIYNFNYVVKNFSNHKNISNKKGDLGWILYDALDNNVKKIVIHLKNNKITSPIQSNIGWHIFKKLNERKVNTCYLIEKNKAYNILLKYKITTAREQWIKELVRLSYVSIIQ
ncbi:Chaperone SurA [Buchnera aphidicola (Cavariella theobaldi)]